MAIAMEIPFWDPSVHVRGSLCPDLEESHLQVRRLPPLSSIHQGRPNRTRNAKPLRKSSPMDQKVNKKALFGLATLALAFCAYAPAQIQSLTMTEMVDIADGAVLGTITNSEVFRVDDPVDGPELFFTTLTIEGRSLSDGTPTTMQVTYHGGFISETEGVFNSEAPMKDDVQICNEVTVFYAWQDNMGGGVAANALTAAHGGLYRVVGGGFVLGRGEGYAVEHNMTTEALETGLSGLYRKKLNR